MPPNVSKKVFKRKIERIKHRKKKQGTEKKEEEVSEVSQAKYEDALEDGNHSDDSFDVEFDGNDESLVRNLNADVDETPALSKKTTKNSIMSDTTFESLRGSVSDRTLDAVAKMGFTHMTEIQQKTIKPLLEVGV